MSDYDHQRYLSTDDSEFQSTGPRYNRPLYRGQHYATQSEATDDSDGTLYDTFDARFVKEPARGRYVEPPQTAEYPTRRRTSSHRETAAPSLVLRKSGDSGPFHRPVSSWCSRCTKVLLYTALLAVIGPILTEFLTEFLNKVQAPPISLPVIVHNATLEACRTTGAQQLPHCKDFGTKGTVEVSYVDSIAESVQLTTRDLDASMAAISLYGDLYKETKILPSSLFHEVLAPSDVCARLKTYDSGLKMFWDMVDSSAGVVHILNFDGLVDNRGLGRLDWIWTHLGLWSKETIARDSLSRSLDGWAKELDFLGDLIQDAVYQWGRIYSATTIAVEHFDHQHYLSTEGKEQKDPRSHKITKPLEEIQRTVSAIHANINAARGVMNVAKIKYGDASSNIFILVFQIEKKESWVNILMDLRKAQTLASNAKRERRDMRS